MLEQNFGNIFPNGYNLSPTLGTLNSTVFIPDFNLTGVRPETWNGLINDQTRISNLISRHITEDGIFKYSELLTANPTPQSINSEGFNIQNGINGITVGGNIIQDRVCNITQRNIRRYKCIIHKIDCVLPFETLLGIIASSPAVFGTLLSNYAKILDTSGPFTVFLPMSPPSPQVSINNLPDYQKEQYVYAHIAEGLYYPSSLNVNDKIFLQRGASSIKMLSATTSDASFDNGGTVENFGTTDITYAVNGIVYGIINWITPRALTMVETIQYEPRLSEFYSIITRQDIQSSLQGSLFGVLPGNSGTVFAPTNDAINSIKTLNNVYLSSQSTAVAKLQDLVRYHVAPPPMQTLVTNAVNLGLSMLNGFSITVLSLSGGIQDTINVAAISFATQELAAPGQSYAMVDIGASDGVVHVIDGVFRTERDDVYSDIIPLYSTVLNQFTEFVDRFGMNNDTLTDYYTHIIAPTDAAWNKLEPQLLEYLQSDAGANDLESLMNDYFITSYSGSRIKTLSNNINVSISFGLFKFAYLTNTDWIATDQNTQIPIQTTDAPEASNGVLIMIDEVLFGVRSIPYLSIYQYIGRIPEYSTFYSLLDYLPDIIALLNDTDSALTYNVFVPSNEAFNKSIKVSELLLNITRLESLVKYHIWPDTQISLRPTSLGEPLKNITTLNGDVVFLPPEDPATGQQFFQDLNDNLISRDLVFIRISGYEARNGYTSRIKSLFTNFPNIEDYIVSRPEFSTLVSILNNTQDGTKTLSNPNTILFAPSNSAFETIPSGAFNLWFKNTNNFAAFKNYYVTALSSFDIDFTQYEQFSDAEGNSANISDIINCENGKIYVISNILAYQSGAFERSIIQYVDQEPNLSTLDSIIDNAPFFAYNKLNDLTEATTLIAPVNSDFWNTAVQMYSAQDLIQYHIIDGIFKDIGQPVSSINGLNMTTFFIQTFSNFASLKVTAQVTNIIDMTNGLIYEVDKVILPGTLAPSERPSANPTIYPTITPTENTLMPSNNPSSIPTKLPTMDPSMSPSTSPSATPTDSPTDTPTSSPLVSDLGGRGANFELRRKKVNEVQKNIDSTFLIVTIIIAGVYGLLTIGGYLHAKINSNDLFGPFSIIIAGVYTYDLFTDIFLAYEMFEVRQSFNKDVVILSLFIISGVTIIVPIIVTLLQLISTTSAWRDSHRSENSRELSSWLLYHGPKLYALAIATGNSYTAINLCNSNLMGISFFSMPLTKDQLLSFKNQRSYSTVLLEVTCFLNILCF